MGRNATVINNDRFKTCLMGFLLEYCRCFCMHTYKVPSLSFISTKIFKKSKGGKWDSFQYSCPRKFIITYSMHMSGILHANSQLFKEENLVQFNVGVGAVYVAPIKECIILSKFPGDW